MIRRLLSLGATLLVLGAAAGCAHVDRPEGVVERWLISLNQGRAGRPGQYAPEALSQRLLPNWENRDPGALDVIEVGKGVVRIGLAPPGASWYLVPFRIQRLNGPTVVGTAGLSRTESRPWRVEQLLPASSTLRVPSQGGTRIGGTPPGVWAGAVAVAAVLILVSIGLMSTFARGFRARGQPSSISR